MDLRLILIRAWSIGCWSMVDAVEGRLRGMERELGKERAEDCGDDASRVMCVGTTASVVIE